MKSDPRSWRKRLRAPPLGAARVAALFSLGLAGCAASQVADRSAAAPVPASQVDSRASLAGLDAAAVLDRLSWGATSSDYERIRAIGVEGWVADQLRPDPDAPLPPPIADRIASMEISRMPLPERIYALETQRKSNDAITDDAVKKAAQHDYQQELNRLGREATTRELLREVYSPKQLQEQMTWFWCNHFSVFEHKHNIRAMVADYEDVLRRHSLGRFRDLLAASAHHPAMLAYLDNAQNAVNHANENYAREILELHTLGVDGGYTQHDVQELARVLTGFGISHEDPATAEMPHIRKELAPQYLRVGLFEFHPGRHDYGDKVILGRTIRGRGIAEFDEVLDLISRHPATAHNVSRKIARFLVADEPAPELVDAMAREFLRSDGDIAAVVNVAIHSPQFAASLRGDFKDPAHFVVSAVRLAYDRRPIVNANPMVNWLNRLGEAPFNHATPDGYSLGESAWSGPGQMAVRFEVAKAIGNGSAGLFRSEDPNPEEQPAFPQLANAMYYESTQRRLAEATRKVLDQAVSPQDWNLLFLSSPEFMQR